MSASCSHVLRDRSQIDALLVRRGLGSPRQPGQPFQHARHFRQPYDVALEGLDQARRFRIRLLHRDQPGQHLQHAERLSDLVAQQTAEASQLRRLALDHLGVHW